MKKGVYRSIHLLPTLPVSEPHSMTALGLPMLEPLLDGLEPTESQWRYLIDLLDDPNLPLSLVRSDKGYNGPHSRQMHELNSLTHFFRIVTQDFRTDWLSVIAQHLPAVDSFESYRQTKPPTGVDVPEGAD